MSTVRVWLQTTDKGTESGQTPYEMTNRINLPVWVFLGKCIIKAGLGVDTEGIRFLWKTALDSDTNEMPLNGPVR